MTKISIFFLTVSLLTLSCSSNSTQSNRDDTANIKALDEATINNVQTKKLCTGWYFVLDTINDFKFQLDKSSEIYYLNPAPIVIQGNFKFTEIYESNFKGRATDYVGLKIQLDEFGTKKWADATEKATYKKLALIIDNKLIAAPLVNNQITMGATAINRSEYNRADIENFKKQLDK